MKIEQEEENKCFDIVIECKRCVFKIHDIWKTFEITDKNFEKDLIKTLTHLQLLISKYTFVKRVSQEPDKKVYIPIKGYLMKKRGFATREKMLKDIQHIRGILKIFNYHDWNRLTQKDKDFVVEKIAEIVYQEKYDSELGGRRNDI